MKMFYLFVAIIVLIIGLFIYGIHGTDKMWTDRCVSQYGRDVEKSPNSGYCILPDGQIRALR